MNEALGNLYSLKWDKLKAGLKPIIEDEKLDIKPANPLLLYIDWIFRSIRPHFSAGY